MIKEGNFHPGVGDNLKGRTLEITHLETSPFSAGLTLVRQHHVYIREWIGAGTFKYFPNSKYEPNFQHIWKDALILNFEREDI